MADWTASDDAKNIFDSSDTILIKLDKITAPSDLNEKLFGQGEKIRKISKEIQLKPLKLAYENFLLYDIENMMTLYETFVTKLNGSISIYGLISFSGETKTDSKLNLISPCNKIKSNLKKDIYENKVGKVHTNTSISTTHNNVLNFDILCTRKNKTVGEKRKESLEIVETIHVLGLLNL